MTDRVDYYDIEDLEGRSDGQSYNDSYYSYQHNVPEYSNAPYQPPESVPPVPLDYDFQPTAQSTTSTVPINLSLDHQVSSMIQNQIYSNYQAPQQYDNLPVHQNLHVVSDVTDPPFEYTPRSMESSPRVPWVTQSRSSDLYVSSENDLLTEDASRQTEVLNESKDFNDQLTPTNKPEPFLVSPFPLLEKNPFFPEAPANIFDDLAPVSDNPQTKQEAPPQSIQSQSNEEVKLPPPPLTQFLNPSPPQVNSKSNFESSRAAQRYPEYHPYMNNAYLPSTSYLPPQAEEVPPNRHEENTHYISDPEGGDNHSQESNQQVVIEPSFPPPADHNPPEVNTEDYQEPSQPQYEQYWSEGNQNYDYSQSEYYPEQSTNESKYDPEFLPDQGRYDQNDSAYYNSMQSYEPYAPVEVAVPSNNPPPEGEQAHQTSEAVAQSESIRSEVKGQQDNETERELSIKQENNSLENTNLVQSYEKQNQEQQQYDYDYENYGKYENYENPNYENLPQQQHADYSRPEHQQDQDHTYYENTQHYDYHYENRQDRSTIYENKPVANSFTSPESRPQSQEQQQYSYQTPPTQQPRISPKNSSLPVSSTPQSAEKRFSYSSYENANNYPNNYPPPAAAVYTHQNTNYNRNQQNQQDQYYNQNYHQNYYNDQYSSNNDYHSQNNNNYYQDNRHNNYPTQHDSNSNYYGNQHQHRQRSNQNYYEDYPQQYDNSNQNYSKNNHYNSNNNYSYDYSQQNGNNYQQKNYQNYQPGHPSYDNYDYSSQHDQPFQYNQYDSKNDQIDYNADLYHQADPSNNNNYSENYDYSSYYQDNNYQYDQDQEEEEQQENYEEYTEEQSTINNTEEYKKYYEDYQNNYNENDQQNYDYTYNSQQQYDAQANYYQEKVETPSDSNKSNYYSSRNMRDPNLPPISSDSSDSDDFPKRPSSLKKKQNQQNKDSTSSSASSTPSKQANQSFLVQQSNNYPSPNDAPISSSLPVYQPELSQPSSSTFTRPSSTMSAPPPTRPPLKSSAATTSSLLLSSQSSETIQQQRQATTITASLPVPPPLTVSQPAATSGAAGGDVPVNQVEKTKKTFLIWERFFENAAKFSDSDKGGFSSDGGTPKIKHSKRHSSSSGQNNHQNHPKEKIFRLSHEIDDKMTSKLNSLSESAEFMNQNNNNNELHSPDLLIDYQSNVGKQYFTFAIAAEQSWPVLISSRKFQSLMNVAKMNLGNPNLSSLSLQQQQIPYYALFASIIISDTNSTNSLLMRGMNPNVLDTQGRSFIHHIARIGDEEMLALLFDSNADLDIADHHGFTPLHIAILFNRLGIVRFLLDSAVDITKKTLTGMNALELAIQSNHHECEQLLTDFIQYSTIYSFDQLRGMNSSQSQQFQQLQQQQSQQSHQVETFSPPPPSISPNSSNSSSSSAAMFSPTPIPPSAIASLQKPPPHPQSSSHHHHPLPPQSLPPPPPPTSSPSSQHIPPPTQHQSAAFRQVTSSPLMIATTSDEEPPSPTAVPLPPPAAQIHKSTKPSKRSSPLTPETLPNQNPSPLLHDQQKELKKKSSTTSAAAELLKTTIENLDPKNRKVSFKRLKQKEKEILEKKIQRRKEQQEQEEDREDGHDQKRDEKNKKKKKKISIKNPDEITSSSSSSSEEESDDDQDADEEEEEEEDIDEEDEQEEDDDGKDNGDKKKKKSKGSAVVGLHFITTFMEKFSSSIWALAISMISLTLMFLTNSSSSSSSSSDSRGSSRKKKSSRSKAEEEEDDILNMISPQAPSTPVAPPTDAELRHIHPSPQQLSPTSSSLTPPNDVQIAIALSRMGKKGLEDASSPRTLARVKKEIANRYSLGSQLPPGTSWRYVNISQDNIDHPKKNS